MNVKWTIAHSLGLFGLLTAIVIIAARPGIPFVTAYYVTLALMTVLGGVIGHGVMGLWRGILIDENDRISLSRVSARTLDRTPAVRSSDGRLRKSVPWPSPPAKSTYSVSS
jgi:hypothetical protein